MTLKAPESGFGGEGGGVGAEEKQNMKFPSEVVGVSCFCCSSDSSILAKERMSCDPQDCFGFLDRSNLASAW